MSQGPCVKIWAQSDKNWPSYEFLKFRPRWNNIQHSGFSTRHTHSEQKTKAFWIPFELNTFYENVVNSICEILAPEPARYDENRPSYDFLNMTQINFCHKFSVWKYLINPHFWRPFDRNWLPAVRDENVDNVKKGFWPPERVQNESRSSSYEFFSA